MKCPIYRTHASKQWLMMFLLLAVCDYFRTSVIKKVVQFYRPRLACCQVPVTASPTTYMFALNQSPCQHEKLLLLQQNSGRRNTYGQKMFGYNYMGHIFLRVTYWCLYTILSTDILLDNQTITIQMTAEKSCTVCCFRPPHTDIEL